MYWFNTQRLKINFSLTLSHRGSHWPCSSQHIPEKRAFKPMDLKGHGPTLRASHIRCGWADASSYLSWRRYLKITHATTPAPMSCSMGRLLIIYVCTTSLQHSSHWCGWQKDHTRVRQCFMLLYQLRWAGTRLPRISFTAWFQEKLDQKRNLHGMRKTKVKQQLSLPEVSHDKVWWLTDRQMQRCPMGPHIHLLPFMLCH